MRNLTLPQAQREAADLVRAKARSFYIASLFLPAKLRRDVQIVYAYYRTVDDLVDEAPVDCPREVILDQLQWWESGLCAEHADKHPLLDEVVRIAKYYEIPSSYLCMVLKGARTDLDLQCIETREELLEYSVYVAGSVGMVMAHILGARSKKAIEMACDLGVAMQLTNILRDVREDLDRGRIYLPRTDLLTAGVSLEALREESVNEALHGVMADIAGEARRRYENGMRGISLLHPTAQFSIYLAALLYSRILDKIESEKFEVLTSRIYLSTLEKWRLAVPAYLQHRQHVLLGRQKWATTPRA